MTETGRLVLHWSPRSPYVRLVTVAAAECGLTDRIKQVRTLVGTYRDIPDGYDDHPLGKIPTLVLPDGRRLYDSRVITEWMAGSTGTRLYPSTFDERIETLRRQALGIGIIDLMVLGLAERLKGRDAPASELYAATAPKLARGLAGLALETEALARTAFDAGHIAIAGALAYADFRFPDFDWRSGHPDLSGWAETAWARPSMRDTVFVDDS